MTLGGSNIGNKSRYFLGVDTYTDTPVGFFNCEDSVLKCVVTASLCLLSLTVNRRRDNVNCKGNISFEVSNAYERQTILFRFHAVEYVYNLKILD